MNPYIAMQVFIALLLVIDAHILCREFEGNGELHVKEQKSVVQHVTVLILALVKSTT